MVQYNQLNMCYYNHIMEHIKFKHIETYLLQIPSFHILNILYILFTYNKLPKEHIHHGQYEII